MSSKEAQTEGRLRARPVRVTGSAPVGLQPLMLSAARDSYLYVPATYRADRPVPLVLLLHGAGGHARQGLDLLRSLAHSAGLILLAPASHDRTWDLLVDRRYGPDAAMIDQALEQTFSRYAIDPGQRYKELVSRLGGYTDVCTRVANPSSKSVCGSLSGRRVSRWPRWDMCSPARRCPPTKWSGTPAGRRKRASLPPGSRTTTTPGLTRRARAHSCGA